MVPTDDALMLKLQSLFPEADWNVLQELFREGAGADLLFLLPTLFVMLCIFVEGGALAIIKFFVAAIPVSVMMSLASYASCQLLDRNRPESPKPLGVSLRARNIFNSLLLLPLVCIGGLLFAILLTASVMAGGGHFAPLVLLPVLAVPLAHFYAFARTGMRFSRKRGLAAMLLFVLLFAALYGMASFCCGQAPVIW